MRDKKGTRIALDQILKIAYCTVGEERRQDILAFLGLCIGQVSKRRAVLAEAFIQCPFLIPAIAVVIYVVVCGGASKVKLVVLFSTQFTGVVLGYLVGANTHNRAYVCSVWRLSAGQDSRGGRAKPYFSCSSARRVVQDCWRKTSWYVLYQLLLAAKVGPGNFARG